MEAYKKFLTQLNFAEVVQMKFVEQDTELGLDSLFCKSAVAEADGFNFWRQKLFHMYESVP